MTAPQSAFIVESRVPGSIAKHAIVSDECRANRGDMKAAHEAVARLVDEYAQCFPAWKDRGAKFHFVLLIERPKKEESK